jgi:hypothetical protein
LHHHPHDEKLSEPISIDQLCEHARQRKQWRTAAVLAALSRTGMRPSEVGSEEAAYCLRQMAKGAAAAGGKELPAAMRRAADAFGKDNAESPKADVLD